MTAFLSAVNGPTDLRLGRKVEVLCKKLVRPLVSMVTMLLSCKLENAVTSRIFGPGCLNLACEPVSVILIHLPKMSEIYLTVLELGPDNMGGN